MRRQYIFALLFGLELASQSLLDLETLQPLVGLLAVVDADTIVGNQGHHFESLVRGIFVVQLHRRNRLLDFLNAAEQILLSLHLLTWACTVGAHVR